MNGSDAGLARERTSLSLDRSVLSGFVVCAVLVRHSLDASPAAYLAIFVVVAACAGLSEWVLHSAASGPAARHNVVLAWSLAAAASVIGCGITTGLTS